MKFHENFPPWNEELVAPLGWRQDRAWLGIRSSICHTRSGFSETVFPTPHLPRTNKPSNPAFHFSPTPLGFLLFNVPPGGWSIRLFLPWYECCNRAKQILASPALCVVLTFCFSVSDTASIVRSVAWTCSSCSASQHLGQIWSYNDQFDWGNHGSPRRAKGCISSRHLFDRMTWPSSQTSAASTPEHSSQSEVLAHFISIRLISILECRLACHGTHRLHLGHCHDPWGCGPLTIFRIRWLTATDPCRRGSRHNNVWSGVSRSGAANICSDEINLECWGLLTCGNCRPRRAWLHNFEHLHSFITQLFCSFTVLLSPPLCLPFYTPYLLIAMISPTAWTISYPCRNYFLLKLMHCTATARLPLRQSLLYVVRFPLLFKYRSAVLVLFNVAYVHPLIILAFSCVPISIKWL